MYGTIVVNLVREWIGSADASYGLVLAAVALGVAWNRRSAVATAAAKSPRPGPLGLIILLVGLLLYLVGQLAADVFLTRVSLLCVMAGALGFVAGFAALRATAAPLIFLLIAIPLPALVVNTVTLPLQLVASRIAESTLMLASVSVFREGNLLTLPSSTLEVAEACSGLRSAISLSAIAVVLAWSLDRGMLRRVALVASAVPVAVVLNGFRIAATGLAVEEWGPAAGKGAWHELTGWITFVASLAVLFGVKRLLSPTSRTRANRPGLVPA